MRPTVAMLTVLVIAAATSPVEAQSRRGDRDGRDRGIVELEPAGQRGGFFITAGVGAGGEQYRFDGDEEFSERLTKPTFTLRLGGTPNQNVRVGAELFVWGNDVPTSLEQDGGFESFGALMVTAQYFPIRDAGLFLKASGGFGVSSFDYDNPLIEDNDESGFAWSLGAGYDIQLSRNFGLGPSIDIYQGSFTSRDQPTLTERVVNIGIQVTFQSNSRGR